MSLLTFCVETKDVWSTVGKVLLVFKIVIPILLIIFGMIDLGKAVIGSDEKAIKEATNSIIRRLIAAIVIFFIPSIVGAIIGLVGSWQEDAKAEDYDVCKTCLTKPGSCSTKAEEASK